MTDVQARVAIQGIALQEIARALSRDQANAVAKAISARVGKLAAETPLSELADAAMGAELFGVLGSLGMMRTPDQVR